MRQALHHGLMLAFWFCASLIAPAATKPHYYGHAAVADAHGVIAPWYQGLNGQCDYRVRIAAETLKRYPWTATNAAMAAYPAYVFSGQWKIATNGAITPVQTSDWDTGDIGQRTVSVLFGMTDYYRYTGDPAAIAHLTYMAEYLLTGCQTPPDHPWPLFPISVPVRGKVYQKCNPEGIIQLDICANMGQGLLRAYQVTGNHRWFAAAAHWGDLLAERCNLDPAGDPWPRYANPDATPWKDNKQTGGVVLILGFLDELVRLGYTGSEERILKARDAGRRYLSEKLLPAWLVDDTWGRYFWDWANPTHCCTLAAEAPAYLLEHRRLFPNWRADARNILTLFYNHSSAAPESGGDVYSGAWAYPESSSCCMRSLWYAPLLVGKTLGQYAVQAEDPWAREMAVRQFILQTYDVHETGASEDNIDGGVEVNGSWFNIAHPLPLRWVQMAMGWLPEELGASRENHIVRSSAVVNSVRYGDGLIEYATFDAPPETVDVLRLSFTPKRITADGRALRQRRDLSDNGYTIKKLPNGDVVVQIRHDGARQLKVTGNDPQQVLDDGSLSFEGVWIVQTNADAWGGSLRVSERKDAVMTADFPGNQVRLIGQAGPEGGLADVYVDGVKQLVPIDFWNPSARSQQVLYYKNGLAEGKHTLKVVARGEKNPYSRGGRVFVDAVQFSTENVASSFPTGAGPTGAQRMIMGYTGRQDYRDSQGQLWRPGTEVVTRLAVLRDTVSDCWWTNAVTEPITGTPDPELYRYGYHARDFWVNLTVGPREYYVRLKFAATRGLDTGKNCFDIHLNGRKVVERLDVAATAGGPNKAADLVFNGVKPKDGIIEIRFTGLLTGDGDQTLRGEAFVQAIEIGPGAGGHGARPVSSSLSFNPARNLLLNPGFEETTAGTAADKYGKYSGEEWRAELRSSGRCYLWQESAFAGRPKEGLPELHAGKGALRTHADKDCHTQVYQDVDVQPGATYTGTVWVSAADLQGKGFGRSAGDSAGLLLLELDKDLKPLGPPARSEIKAAGPYTRLTQTIRTGPHTVKLRFVLETVLNCSVWDGHVTYDGCELRMNPGTP
ncbi:MAG TPA: malectin domain-containing carbohydrate-binding protein [Candidatus Paceibacterota bacterium]|nr:malectin domain-containing carbohydrate-binding protein [Verrucomicrobiota bacterium]HSA12387.1 malectin domain-containing carbohydrate-binding protein [Candidatus Paceibacterota bacterium]